MTPARPIQDDSLSQTWELLIATRIANKKKLASGHDTLISKAGALFVEKGYHETTTREIAEAVGWNVATMYLYVAAKEDLLYLIGYRNHLIRLAALAEVDTGGRPVEVFDRLIDTHFRLSDKIALATRLVNRDASVLRKHQAVQLRAMEGVQLEVFADAIRACIEAGEFEPINPELLAMMIVMQGSMWAMKWYALQDQFSFGEVVEAQIDMIHKYVGRRNSAT